MAQTIENPNSALRSHETLLITKIELSHEKTVVHFSIENRIEKGSFCADKNIYLIDPSGEKLKLIKSSGIPVCPDVHNFMAPGEKLYFTLTFPPLKPSTVCIDLREECAENCFSFYGIVLDNFLNIELDNAFRLAESGERLKALERFIGLAGENKNRTGIEALFYFNIIKLATETGNEPEASEWYKKLNTLNLPMVKLYIEQLNLQGIKY